MSRKISQEKTGSEAVGHLSVWILYAYYYVHRFAVSFVSFFMAVVSGRCLPTWESVKEAHKNYDMLFWQNTRRLMWEINSNPERRNEFSPWQVELIEVAYALAGKRNLKAKDE